MTLTRAAPKEFSAPGEGSVEAARVAMAVRMQAPKKYLEIHTKLLGAAVMPTKRARWRWQGHGA